MVESYRYSELYERALRVSAVAHRQQNRKGSVIPYITHPVHVSTILLRYGFPMEVIVAGLLHDVVEDQGYPLAAIESEFGPRVAGIVGALSENKSDNQGNKRPWEVRKQEGVVKIRQASPEAAAVKAADTLHNIRSTLYDVSQHGTTVFDRFSRGPQQIVQNYREILQLVRERLAPHPLADELAAAVEDFVQLAHNLTAPPDTE